jgi:hypothetical protein
MNTQPMIVQLFLLSRNVSMNKPMLLNSFQMPNNNPYLQTYNPSWRNHPNFSWKNKNNNAQTSQPPFEEHHNFQNSHGYTPSHDPLS